MIRRMIKVLHVGRSETLLKCFSSPWYTKEAALGIKEYVENFRWLTHIAKTRASHLSDWIWIDDGRKHVRILSVNKIQKSCDLLPLTINIRAIADEHFLHGILHVSDTLSISCLIEH